MYLDCSLFIIVIKTIQPDCDKIKGISVLLLETPLTRSKYFSPYTHAQHLTRTSRTFYTFAYNIPLHQHLQLQISNFPHIPEDVHVTTKQVQAENANALRKSSDSETDRLQDIQEEPRRRIEPSLVKELAKFFKPTLDEEENSHVNNRMRRKKLFELKKEEENKK